MRPCKVSKDLSGALAEEQKRHAIDAAKKKAVSQHADYDTFKKMVSVAHLKPLHAPSGHGSKGCSLPAWQLDPSTIGAQHCSGTEDACSSRGSSVDAQQQPPSQQLSASQAHTAAAAKPASVPPSVLPCTSQEFARDWRKHCPTVADKYRLLQRCGPAKLAQIFRVEVDSILLGQILQVIQLQWKHTAQHVQEQQQHYTTAAPQQDYTIPSASQQQQQQEEGAAPPATQQEHNQQQEVAPSARHPQQQQTPQALAGCLGHSMATAAAAAAGVEHAAAWATDDVLLAEAVLLVGMLQSLAGAGRFDLNVRLMDKTSKAAAAGLCSELQELLQRHAARQHAPATASDPGGVGSGSSAGGTSNNSSSSSSRHKGADSNALADLQAVILKLRV